MIRFNSAAGQFFYLPNFMGPIPASPSLPAGLPAATAAEAQGIGLLPISYMTMIAAATAFSTPIGFQTNLMVYGPGGYKYTDFLRLGLPLQVLVGISTITIIALLWL